MPSLATPPVRRTKRRLRGSRIKGILSRLPGFHCRKDTTGKKSDHIPFLACEVNVRRRPRDPMCSRSVSKSQKTSAMLAGLGD